MGKLQKVAVAGVVTAATIVTATSLVAMAAERSRQQEIMKHHREVEARVRNIMAKNAKLRNQPLSNNVLKAARELGLKNNAKRTALPAYPVFEEKHEDKQNA